MAMRSPAVSKKKRRISRACEPCHRSKVSCDEGRPCTRCRTRNIVAECCDYVRKKRVRRPKAEGTAHGDKPNGSLPSPSGFDAGSEDENDLVMDSESTPRSLSLPMDISHAPPLIPATNSFQDIFGMLFNIFQTLVSRSPGLPDPNVVRMTLGLWKPNLTPDQISVLVDYLASFGDESYQRAVNEAKTSPSLICKSITLKMLEENTLPTLKDSKLLDTFSPNQIEFLPFPVLYSTIDEDSRSFFSYANRELHNLLEYGPQEINNTAASTISNFFARFTAGHAFSRTFESFTYFNLSGETTYTIDSTAVTKTGVEIPVRLKCSVHIWPNSKGRTAMVCFVPIKNPQTRRQGTNSDDTVSEIRSDSDVGQESGSGSGKNNGNGKKRVKTSPISDSSSVGVSAAYGVGSPFSNGSTATANNNKLSRIKPEIEFESTPIVGSSLISPFSSPFPSTSLPSMHYPHLYASQPFFGNHTAVSSSSSDPYLPHHQIKIPSPSTRPVTASPTAMFAFSPAPPSSSVPPLERSANSPFARPAKFDLPTRNQLLPLSSATAANGSYPPLSSVTPVSSAVPFSVSPFLAGIHTSSRLPVECIPAPAANRPAIGSDVNQQPVPKQPLDPLPVRPSSASASASASASSASASASSSSSSSSSSLVLSSSPSACVSTVSPFGSSAAALDGFDSLFRYPT